MPTKFFQEWKAYRAQLLPPDASESRLAENRQAFYMGGHALLQLLTRMMSSAETPTEEDVKAVSDARHELESFAQQLR